MPSFKKLIQSGSNAALSSLNVTNAITASSYVDSSGISITGSSLITASVSTNIITFTKGDNSQFSITVDTGSGGGGGISSVVEDTTPQLGGNLDLNGSNISGSGHIDIDGSITASGDLVFPSSTSKIIIGNTSSNYAWTLENITAKQIHVCSNSNKIFEIDANALAETGTIGYGDLDGIATGPTYIMSFVSKNHSFTGPITSSNSISTSENLSGSYMYLNGSGSTGKDTLTVKGAGLNQFKVENDGNSAFHINVDISGESGDIHLGDKDGAGTGILYQQNYDTSYHRFYGPVGFGKIPDNVYSISTILGITSSLFEGTNVILNSNSILPTASTDTGTSIDLRYIGGFRANDGNANTNPTFTTASGAVLGGWTRILVRTSSAHTVNGATQLLGSPFVSGSDMYIVAEMGALEATYYYQAVSGSETIIVTDTSTTHTLIPTDESIVRKFTNHGSITVTVNSGSLENEGDLAEVDQWGSGSLTVAAGNATLYVNENRTLVSDGQYSRIGIQKMSTTEYRVIGELANA